MGIPQYLALPPLVFCPRDDPIMPLVDASRCEPRDLLIKPCALQQSVPGVMSWLERDRSPMAACLLQHNLHAS